MRLEPDTRARIETIAKANGRSLNAQLTLIVESALQGEPEIKGLMGDAMREEVRKIAREIVQEELSKQSKKI